jgi:hypothetical protein
MTDIQYPPEDDRRPHTALERHLTVGPHIYQITASGTGDDRIGLTLVGWDAEGQVVSEVSGGISAGDLPAVADALTSTLAGLAALRGHGTAPAAPAPVDGQKRHPNQGVRWTEEDDERLRARHGEGASRKELMEEFGRSRGGITARLERLGLIEPEGTEGEGEALAA